jgi:hypothetical protein
VHSSGSARVGIGRTAGIIGESARAIEPAVLGGVIRMLQNRANLCRVSDTGRQITL